MINDIEILFEKFSEYMEERGIDVPEDKETLNQLFEQFMEEYNGGGAAFPRKSPSPSTAEDYVFLAYEADTEEEALAYARRALMIDKENLDANAMVAEITAKDEDALQKKYVQLIKKGEKQLAEHGFWDEDSFGSFWGILETRPYMRLRYSFIELLIHLGKYRKAISQCEDMMRLSENDNMGIRIKLMHLYAFYEDEVSAMRIYKKYNGFQDSSLLLPLIVLYYKLDDYVQAKKYLKILLNANPDAADFFSDLSSQEISDNLMEVAESGAYRADSSEELLMILVENPYLYLCTGGVMGWICRNLG